MPALSAIKAVAFQYESRESVKPLLETFRTMVNHALWIGTRKRIRGRFRLIMAVYGEFKRYGLHTHYTLSACEVASAILKNHRRKHRAPVARRLFLKLDSQSYKLQGENLRIPIKPRQYVILKLRFGEYQRRFLEDSRLRIGSVTLTESKLVVAFKKAEPKRLDYQSVIAYDTNELSLDGAFSNGSEIKPIVIDLREISRIRAFHFNRRRQLQSRLAHCQRRLRMKLAKSRERERRRVDCVLHGVAKRQVSFAKENNAKVILEDLKGVRWAVNRRVSKLNPYNSRLQQVSVHSKSLRRRLNSWPFRRVHAFIEYKAAWENVPLSYVPAKYTSRACPRCGCLQTGHTGELDLKTRQVFQCPRCGWRCNRHLNAALNLLKTQDEGRWFSPDRFPNEVMTVVRRAYGEEARPDASRPEPQNPFNEADVN